VWGEHEVGGSRVLYISNVDLGFLAWRDPRYLGQEPLPHRTWEALRKVPFEFIGMGALMTGIWWVIDRRMQREREQGDGDVPPEAGGGKETDGAGSDHDGGEGR